MLFIVFTVFFTLFSYTVAKEQWQKFDFDTMVKLQDNISPKFDGIFSWFSLLGSVEATIGLSFLLAFFALLRKRFMASAGWLAIIPATIGEVFGKLTIFHPGPPAFFHRSVLPTGLPSFYIHTNFSYPSGHMTRTVFIAVVFACLVIFSVKRPSFKQSLRLRLKLFSLSFLATLVFLMALTRVYLGEHWFSDVAGGTLLGSAFGFLGAVLILKTKKG